MTATPAIRTELGPATRSAIAAARARLVEPTDLVAAIERWAADEQRLDGRGRKARSTDAAVAERRAVVAMVAEGASAAGNGPLTSRGVAYRLEVLGLPKTDALFRRVEEDVLVLRDSGLVAWEAIADGSRRDSERPANRHLSPVEVCTGVCTPSHESHADSRAARCREGR